MGKKNRPKLDWSSKGMVRVEGAPEYAYNRYGELHVFNPQYGWVKMHRGSGALRAYVARKKEHLLRRTKTRSSR